VGVSIGGYLLFEFWRRHRDRVTALVLANTKAGGETPESRTARLQSAEKVLREGSAWFIDDMASKLVSSSTRSNRPDIVEAARAMMRTMYAQDIAGVQQGIADRPDSVSTLASIKVPTLLIAGEEDSVPLAEMELMRQRIGGSQLRVIPNAGHYAALERPEEFGRLLRAFFDTLPRWG
jgi:pimeloyl-ACP methyl ester carboxylesterase